MREFALAIALSALVLMGALFLPYSTRSELPPLPAASQLTSNAAPPRTTVAPTTQLPPPTPNSAAAPAPPAGSAPNSSHQHAKANTGRAAESQPSQPTVSGDVRHGREVYRKRVACHSLEPGKNTLGPSLAGIIGKKAATPAAQTVVEAVISRDVPGNYILVDHALSRAERGLIGILQVEGPPSPDIFDGKVEPGSGH